MTKTTKKFVIIDGNALLHRAWHALPPLTTKDGKLVNAVYGFTAILLNIIKEFHPEYGAVAFDPPGKTFRHDQYSDYKATREKQPDELYEQIPLIKEVAQSFGWRIEEHARFEADDVLGTLAERASEEAEHPKTIIVTGDMDALQLVDDKTVVYTLKKGISETATYDMAAVKERFGFGPEKVVEYKALAGDSSDNIPGVVGIGEKTAKELLAHFESIDEIYDYLDKDGGVKIKEAVAKKLREHRKEAYLSRELATIKRDVKIKFKLSEFVVKPAKREELFEIFRKLEFRSLLNRAQAVLGAVGESTPTPSRTTPFPPLPLRPASRESRGFGGQVAKEGIPSGRAGGQDSLFSAKPAPSGDFKIRHGYHLVETKAKAEELAKELSRASAIAIDTETDGLGGLTAPMIGLSLCAKTGEAYYVVAPLVEHFRDVLANPRVKKYGHNLKYDIEVLRHAGYNVQGVDFDTKIAAYLLRPQSRSNHLDNLAFVELKHEMVSIESLIGKRGKKQGSLADLPAEVVADYSAEDADYTFRLVNRLEPQLKKEHLYKLFTEMEMPLLPVLAQMEENGVKIDAKFLEKMSAQVGKQITSWERKIHKLAGVDFNVASPLQLKEVLFEKLKISTVGVGKTKTGLSTAADELDKLADKHPIIKPILQHRELAKLKNTYLDALPELVNPQTGRVHTSFNQTVASTGRLSSSDPNLQNIPIRTPLGRQIRKAFIAERGNVLVSADYSQIELRVAADLSNDQKLIEIFRAGKDIHAATAAFVHQIPEASVTPEIRRTAKEVNFGVLYGMGPHGLASRTGMSYARAKEFIDRYFSNYVGLAKYIEEVKDMARSLGYVETKFGRRLPLPDIVSGVAQIRAAAERLATNMPIQGTAADIVKMAMIEIHKGLSKVSSEAKMLMQVHDELVFEVPERDVKKVSEFVQETMESAVKLKVPVAAEVHSGKNWDEAH